MTVGENKESTMSGNVGFKHSPMKCTALYAKLIRTKNIYHITGNQHFKMT